MNEATIGQLVIVALSVISTAAMLFKTGKDQKHAIEMMRVQHLLDREDRESSARLLRQETRLTAAEQAARSGEQALALRDRVDTSASKLETHVQATASHLQEQVVETATALQAKVDQTAVKVFTDAKKALTDQTAQISDAIEKAKVFTANKAHEAFEEANSVNRKIEMLHLENVAQAEILKDILLEIQKRDHIPKKGSP